jgi:acyl carrier protein
MNRATVSIDDILKLIGLQLGKRNVRAADRLVEELGAESADLANIVAATEEKYNITIKESDIVHIFTPQDLFDLVNKRLL